MGCCLFISSFLRMQPRLNCLPIVRTVWADFISGFGKVVIIISVFNESDQWKMYGLHIDAVAYSLCLNALVLYRDIVKLPFIRHYIMRYIFKWYLAFQKYFLRIQQNSTSENVWLAQHSDKEGAGGFIKKYFSSNIKASHLYLGFRAKS